MDASPKNTPALAEVQSFENCPPIDLGLAEQEVVTARHEARVITRRKLLTALAITAVAAKVGYTDIVKPIAAEVSTREWPNRPMSINVINPHAKTADPQHYNIFWPGLGQMDVLNGAYEYRDVINDRELIAEVELPSGYFTEFDIARGLWDFYRTHNVGSVSMKNFSMGSTEMFLGMAAADRHILNGIQSGEYDPWTRLPEMAKFTAISSPGDLSDTFRGSIGVYISQMADTLRVDPDVIFKAIYVTATGDNDATKLLDTTNNQRLIQYFQRVTNEVFNTSNPKTTLSQFRLLVGYNIVSQASAFANLVRHDTESEYALTGYGDDVVDVSQACGKYEQAAKIWGTKFSSFTFQGDHASTLGYAAYVKAKRAHDKDFL